MDELVNCVRFPTDHTICPKIAAFPNFREFFDAAAHPYATARIAQATVHGSKKKKVIPQAGEMSIL